MDSAACVMALAAFGGELSVAWGNADHHCAASLGQPKAQAADFIALIDQVRQGPWQDNPVGWVACDAGPGAFTSLRLQASVAQSLAFGWGCPVVMVPTLSRLAFEAWRQAQRPVSRGLWCVALDARLDEVYWQAFESGPHGPQPLGAPQVEAPQTMLAAWQLRCNMHPGAQLHLVGEGFSSVASLSEYRLRSPAVHCVSSEPAALSALVWSLSHGAPMACPPEAAQLLYVRNQVALTSREQQALRAERAS
jgi:tRNA threonylcarbamoyladenosine biosynthesis protein TsaB